MNRTIVNTAQLFTGIVPFGTEGQQHSLAAMKDDEVKGLIQSSILKYASDSREKTSLKAT